MDDLLNLFGVLSDKTRLRIVLLLLKHELCVCQIFAILDMSQPRVSRQLAILKQAKILKDRREGKWVYYRLDENAAASYVGEILSRIPAWLQDDPEFSQDQATLQRICCDENLTCK